jgi:hypothetical protein
MRGGARIGCVVNGAAGRETEFANPRPPKGERIAVIGAGPAGLTYASLVADTNEVTVFEKKSRPGGAFRYAGKAPLFQEVEASEASFARYIADLCKAWCSKWRVVPFQHRCLARQELARTIDRIVIASGARYRYGLGPIVTSCLDWGFARRPGIAFFSDRLRKWFYSLRAPELPVNSAIGKQSSDRHCRGRRLARAKARGRAAPSTPPCFEYGRHRVDRDHNHHRHARA